jgi:hypothetical protein
LILHFQQVHLVKLSNWHPFHKFAKSNFLIVIKFTKLSTTHIAKLPTPCRQCYIANLSSLSNYPKCFEMLQVAQFCLNLFFWGQILPQKVRQPNFHTLPKGSRLCLFLLIFFNFVSCMRAHPNFIHKIPSTKIHNKIICFMLIISCVSYVGLKAPWLFNAIAYLMPLQFWGEGKLHVTR